MTHLSGLEAARTACMIRREAHLTFRREAVDRETRSHETSAALVVWECVEAIDELIEKVKGEAV